MQNNARNRKSNENLNKDQMILNKKAKGKHRSKLTTGVIVMNTMKHKLPLTVIQFVAVALSVVVSLLPPLVLERAVNDLTDGKALAFGLALGYFGLIVLGGVVDSFKEGILIVFGQKITHGLRSEMAAKIDRLDAEQINGKQAGSMVSRFVGDVDTVEDMFSSGITGMFADLCKIISIYVIIWTRSLGLAITLVMVIPLIFLFTRAVQKRMLTAQIQNRVAASKVTNHVPETIRSIRTIHTLGTERYMQRKYEQYIDEGYRAIEKTNFYDAIYSPIIKIFNAVVVAIVMVLAASGEPRLTALFGMSVGSAVAIMNYIGQIFSPIEGIGMEIQTIQSAIAGIKRIDEFLAEEERQIPNEHVTVFEEGRNLRRHDESEINQNTAVKESIAPVENGGNSIESSVVSLQNVTFGYDEKTVLRDLNMQIGAGEHVTLVGRTGAGKSTIFKLILGLYMPRSGRVSVMGTEAASLCDMDKRHIFGYVEQSFHQVPGTIRDQITLGDEQITDEQIVKAAKIVGLDNVISTMPKGYDTMCKEDIFSAGQWQLLSIARAIVANPKILLLDEITANLDADTEQMVLGALTKASEGRMLISISHRLYEKIGENEEQRVIEL